MQISRDGRVNSHLLPSFVIGYGEGGKHMEAKGADHFSDFHIAAYPIPLEAGSEFLLLLGNPAVNLWALKGCRLYFS